MRSFLLGLLWSVGCGGGDPCPTSETVLVEGAEALTCEDAEGVVSYAAVLAGRPATKQRRVILNAVKQRYSQDPVAGRKWLDQMSQDRNKLEGLTGFEAAGARARAVYQQHVGKGLVAKDDADLFGAIQAAVAVWSVHAGDGVALTESDIEGWILYGSLCREVQGASVLRISVADRLAVYAGIQERWDSGTPTDRISLTAMGPFWHEVIPKWQSASFEEQQSWASSAPLPPPMTATSLGYLGAIVEGDLVGHAAVLHSELGPLHLRR